MGPPHKTKLNVNGEEREITELPNLPRANVMDMGGDMIAQPKYDFGIKSLPRWLDEINPDILWTINDIQMVQHVPGVLYKEKINIKVMNLPQKTWVTDEDIRMQVEGELVRLKEKYPRDCKWIASSPQDGVPPIPSWEQIYQMADQIVAFTKFGQDVFRKYFGMDVPYIYHCIDTSIFKPLDRMQCLQWYCQSMGINIPQNAFIIGDLNRNQPRKQPARLIKAFSKFAKDKNDVFLDMQMDWRDVFGWDLNYIGQRPSPFLGDNVRGKMLPPMPVGIPKPQLAMVYGMWDLYATAQAGEGFALCTAEALSTGTPAISTKYTTSDELIIEGEPSPRGMTIEYDTLFWDKHDVAACMRALINEDRMAEAFQYYYEDRELIYRHGENGRRWVEKHLSPKVIEPQWIKLMNETLNKDN